MARAPTLARVHLVSIWVEGSEKIVEMRSRVTIGGLRDVGVQLEGESSGGVTEAMLNDSRMFTGARPWRRPRHGPRPLTQASTPAPGEGWVP